MFTTITATASLIAAVLALAWAASLKVTLVRLARTQRELNADLEKEVEDVNHGLQSHIEDAVLEEDLDERVKETDAFEDIERRLDDLEDLDDKVEDLSDDIGQALEDGKKLLKLFGGLRDELSQKIEEEVADDSQLTPADLHKMLNDNELIKDVLERLCKLESRQ